jgi:hypothetical protein
MRHGSFSNSEIVQSWVGFDSGGWKKLIETMESNKPNFAKQFFVDKAIDEAALILERIDRKWLPT